MIYLTPLPSKSKLEIRLEGSDKSVCVSLKKVHGQKFWCVHCKANTELIEVTDQLDVYCCKCPHFAPRRQRLFELRKRCQEVFSMLGMTALQITNAANAQDEARARELGEWPQLARLRYIRGGCKRVQEVATIEMLAAMRVGNDLLLDPTVTGKGTIMGGMARALFVINGTTTSLEEYDSSTAQDQARTFDMPPGSDSTPADGDAFGVGPSPSPKDSAPNSKRE